MVCVDVPCLLAAAVYLKKYGVDLLQIIVAANCGQWKFLEGSIEPTTFHDFIGCIGWWKGYFGRAE